MANNKFQKEYDAINMLLNEEQEAGEKKGTEIKTPATKAAANKCIKSVRAVTFEFERATDILSKYIQKKNPKSKDFGVLESYKKECAELKSYAMGLNMDGFQQNLKELSKKTINLMKSFDKKVLTVAKKNQADEVAKTMTKIPPLVIETLQSFNDYTIANIKEINKYKPKIDALAKDNDPVPLKKKPLPQEEIPAKKKVLHEGLKEFAGGMASGAGTFLGNVWDMVTFRTFNNELKKEYKKTIDNDSMDTRGYAFVCKGAVDAENNIDALGNLWTKKIDTDDSEGISLGKLGQFFGSQEMGRTVGGILACVALIYVLKVIYTYIKRIFR